MPTRYGNQNPTVSLILPYTTTLGGEAIASYEASGRTAQPWQVNLNNGILAVNEDGLYVHTKVGYSVPRRNGKGEILTMRELFGLEKGEKIMHTAHRTTTSSAAAYRLAKLLADKGYTEVIRPKKGEIYEKSYTFSKQYGLETITLLDEGGGSVAFRTRTSKGGLGEGYDVLIIDEAQEYTSDQQSTLQFIVSDSANPQIILCGTPPTAVSSGDVFVKLRDECVDGTVEDTMWAEWSVPQMSDVNDVDLWYHCNPAMGYQLNERKIKSEDKTDEVDYNIQRFGLWIKYNQKSAISETEWTELQVQEVPKRDGPMCIGIKYGIDGTNVAMAIAYKTDNKFFVECIDCKSVRSGTDWMIRFLTNTNVASIVVDGASGQPILKKAMEDAGIKKKPIFPTSMEYITANTEFEQAVFNGGLCHMGQPALMQAASNCEKRLIGSKGGFGYKSLKPDIEIALLDSVILAMWGAAQCKEKKQKVNY